MNAKFNKLQFIPKIKLQEVINLNYCNFFTLM